MDILGEPWCIGVWSSRENNSISSVITFETISGKQEMITYQETKGVIFTKSRQSFIKSTERFGKTSHPTGIIKIKIDNNR